ncbi:MAG: hypothetical protein O3C19_01095 [Bacteroidetes bacterium]|nr:hypothetical protein [Bacteroidota bacterium]
MRRPPISSFIHFVNTYSIWVSLGSFSSYLFFSRIYEVKPNMLVALGLCLGVWFIYTLDHLLDALNLKENASTRRHTIHYVHQKRIKTILVFVAITLGIMAFYVPKVYYTFCGLLVALTGLHFLINYLVSEDAKRKFFLKEVFIAFVVTLGFMLTPYIEAPCKKIFIEARFLFGVFYCINLSNLILFSYFDKEEDEMAKTISIASIYDDNTIKKFVYASLTLAMIWSAISLQSSEIELLHFFLFASMIITLFVIALFSTFFKTNDRYRFWGDFIYVYPLFVLPFL